MAFIAYWKTTTGFNTQDYPVTIGKKLKECSVAELTGHPMCGSMSPWGNIAFTAKSSDLGTSSVIKDITGGVMFKEPILNSKSNEQANEPANIGDTAKIYRRTIFIAHKINISIPQNAIDDTCSDDIYIVDNITAPNKLVYNFTNASGLTTNDGGTITVKLGGYDLKHTCQKGQTAHATAPNQVTYTDNTNPNNPVTTNYGICLAFVYVVDNKAFVTFDDHLGDFGFRYKNNVTADQYNFLSGGNNYKSFKSTDNYRLFIGSNPNGTNREATLAEIFPGCFADPVPNPAVFINTYYVTNLTTVQVTSTKFKFSLVNGTVGTSVESRTLHQTLSGDTAVEARLQQICRAGIYFVFDGQLLKPIIVGGVVVGYGTPEKVSEIDTYTDLNHPVPTGPGGGGGGGGGGTPGEWDDMPGAGSSIGALAGVRCYVCSKTDITNLRSWMSKTEAQGGPPDGYDVLSSLISVMAFPISMTRASSGPAEAISFTGLKTATDSALMNIATALLSISNQVGATPTTEVKTFTSTATGLPSAGNPFTIDLGSCDCPEFYSDSYPFVDYDASVELYLPFIGTMSLDTQTVMGKTLHAYMSVDPITGAIYAWCECSKNRQRVIVASGAGAIGVNTPISANQVGMAMAQIKNNAAQARNSLIQSAATMAVGAVAGVEKNTSAILMKYINSGNKNIAIAGAKDYMEALSVGAGQASVMAIPNAIGASLNHGRANRQIAQANHNNITGSAGGSTADWACSYVPYLKIITPDVHDAGSQYEHTHGVPTYESGTLSSFSGLTFCANPDVSSISTATDQEKQQIFALLSGGVYV